MIGSFLRGALALVQRLIQKRQLSLRIFKPDGGGRLSLPLWMRGGVSARWRGGKEPTARDGRRWFQVALDWEFPRADVGARAVIYPRQHEKQLFLSLYFLPVTLRFGYEGSVPRFWPHMRSCEMRAIEASAAASGWLSWVLYMPEHEQKPDEPRWRRFHADIRDLIFGREEFKSRGTPETYKLRLPLPAGPVPVEIVEQRILRRRPRWPKVTSFSSFSIRSAEFAQSAGMPWASLPANGLADAIGQFMGMIVKNQGISGWRWTQTRAHCVHCQGMGLIFSGTLIANCKCGNGQRPIDELAREVFSIAASVHSQGESPEVDRLLGMVAEEATGELVRAVLRSGPTGQTWPLLISAALLFVQRGRIGSAAEVAGLALEHSSQPVQSHEAKRLLALISRMDENAPPKVDLFPQLQPEGGISLVPVWRSMHDFARILSTEETERNDAAVNYQKLLVLLDALVGHARQAGWSGAQPLPDFINTLRTERNAAADRLDAARRTFMDVCSVSIPDGMAGDPLRQLLPRLQAALNGEAAS